MSRGCRFFTFFLFILDLIFLNFSYYTAVYIRLGGVVSLQYRLLWTYFNVVTLLTFLGMGMYEQRSSVRKREEILRTLKSVTVSVVIVFSSVVYVYYHTYFSRLVFLYFWILAVSSLSLGRLLFKKFEHYLINMGVGVKRVLIIGADQTGQAVREKIEIEKLLGYQFIGFLDDTVNGEHILGKIKDLENLLKTKAVDQVFLTLTELPKRKELHLALLCRKYGIDISVISPIFDILNQISTTNEYFGIPTVRLRPSSLHGFNRVLKRLLDIAIALIMIVFFLPLWIIIAILIKLDSPGSIFFKQTRVGRDGKNFELYKFRSMCDNAHSQLDELRQFNETNGPIFKMVKDPRVTRVGRFLRKCSLDEFPQFINVLKGEMSVVGPRPPIPAEVVKYDDWHKRRLEIDQGITGLWQISGRSKLSFEEMVLLDILYVENWSVWLDITILLKTIPTVLRAEGAY